ncbi:hypothetical protein SLH49_12065 [Cognatiyoonia sp. IB215446]|uniref:hypothetical protein n=1 Tax=Cognatiyoonia sp. IB215446 TaxID=3097355 RepID=UPI002A0B267A|nr:hypothetical protein [Cognatiyoonia sp. IB215446]MDX8348716.1 hypothetical protein [Cognatiyoonia sp. IB215446]
MSFEMGILLTSIVAFIIGAAAIVLGDKRRRNAPTQNRGSNPGQGHHLMHANYSPGNDTTESRTWHAPRDPQSYAKFFAPSKMDRKK